jgi:predicted ATPase
MLLRLRVKNFKNLEDVEIRFGPLTCFVGTNGVGKSNILDAIQFLRALTEHDIQKAASMVRSPVSGEFGPRDLFFGGDWSRPMQFEADMLVPERVIDDFGRETVPATTLLRYSVEFGLVANGMPRLVLNREVLEPIKAGLAKDTLGFPHKKEFLKSVVKPTRRIGVFISTADEGQGAGPEIKLHQDGGSRGQAFAPGKSPRTVVGGTNVAEYPTVLAARREMASWMIVQLEPSAIRTPDRVGGPDKVDERGRHVAATLDRLRSTEETTGRTLAETVNRLARLVPEVRGIEIDRDEARQQLTVMATLEGCRENMGPRSLSDGTLRFLALVTMFMDQDAGELLCMEEPENGIHPGRVPAAVELLEEYCVDVEHAVGPDNPLRQVIINTHSPDVVRQLGNCDLLFVDTVNSPRGNYAIVRGVEGGWRKDASLVPLKRMGDFIGGAPVGKKFEQMNLPFEIGTVET